MESFSRRLLDAVAAIGEERSFLGFCKRTNEEIGRLIPNDRVFCNIATVGPGQTVERVQLLASHVPSDACRAYETHYYYLDPARKATTPSMRLLSADWKQRAMRGEEFSVDFAHAIMHMDFSGGIPLLDPSGLGGLCFGFTRSRTSRLSASDEKTLLALRPHVANFVAILRTWDALPGECFYAAELSAESRLLSRREAEIAGLLCKRLRTAEIATFLLISPRTVERHVEHIYDKLNVRNRRQLVTRLLCGAPSVTPSTCWKPHFS